MKRIAILQSNYIPWKGYFDLINTVDEFVLYDDVQYTKNDWRNRNKIKTKQGVEWLTIPVRQENMNQKIKDTKVIDDRWRKKHWKSITQNYSKAKYFKFYKEIFEEEFLNSKEQYISIINCNFIKIINNILGINTKIRFSSEFKLLGDKTERLLNICNDCKADTYLSGPLAQDYFDMTLAEERNINIEWMNYNGYKEYSQLFSNFEHRVTILDLLFNEGINSKSFMKSFT